MGVTRSHEVVTARLHSMLDQILLQPPYAAMVGEGDTEDEQSCCFKATDAKSRAAVSCKACVMLLPY
jgi:hypothetical protein